MRPSRRKILFAFDRDVSEQAVVQAIRLLHATGGSAELIRLIDEPKNREAARRQLAAVRDRLEAQGMDEVSVHVVSDEPAQSILFMARDVGATFIAITERRAQDESGEASVASEVVKRATVPVLVLRPESLASDGSARVARILVPIDRSHRSEAILPTACMLAREHGAELVLLHVIDLSWCRHPDVARSHEVTAATAHLARSIGELGYPARPLVAEGDPAAKIIETARREKADVIAMMTHGRSGVALSYSGSVAGEVMKRSPCPVLVCRDAPANVSK